MRGSIEGLDPAHQLQVDVRRGEFEHPSLDVERMGGAGPPVPGMVREPVVTPAGSSRGNQVGMNLEIGWTYGNRTGAY